MPCSRRGWSPAPYLNHWPCGGGCMTSHFCGLYGIYAAYRLRGGSPNDFQGCQSRSYFQGCPCRLYKVFDGFKNYFPLIQNLFILLIFCSRGLTDKQFFDSKQAFPKISLELPSFTKINILNSNMTIQKN